jgi:hypothetical protein
MTPLYALSLALLLLVGTVSATTCDIEGTLSESTYDGGDTVEYTVETTPSHGFVRLEVEGPVGDEIYSLTREINGEFTLEFDTDDTFLNGTYKARGYLLEYYENSTLHNCSTSTSSTFELNTPHGSDQVKLIIDLSAQYDEENVTTTGSVEKDGVTYAGTLTASGVKAMIPDFQISDINFITTGGNGCKANLVIETCQSDDAWRQTVTEMTSWYNTEKTACEEKKTLSGQCVEAYSQLTEDYNTSQSNYIKEKARADGKWDVWVSIPVFIFGMFFMYMLFFLVKSRYSGGDSVPHEMKMGMV